MKCRNCEKYEATATAVIVAEGHVLRGVCIALCDDCAYSEERPALFIDPMPRWETARRAVEGTEELWHFVCSTPLYVPCACVGHENEWDECCCSPADRSFPRTWCEGCGTIMFATNFETGEPIEVQT